MDTNHPTTQFLILIGIKDIMALLIVLSLWLSGDVYIWNCEINCYIASK